MHYIDENTDFRALNLRRQPVWYCGDIDGLGEYYESTSTRKRSYNSTIVWPVFAGDGNGQVALKAFFCIDSPKANAFKKSRDIDIGWVVVDALSRAYERATPHRLQLE